ncbi:MAG: S26 family signal peptidase [Polyangiaceae bacterium]
MRQSHGLRPTFPDWSAALIIELLRAGKPARFRARGGSMWPRIPGGSLIEVTPGVPRAAGELVAFERAGRVVIHRVLQITAAGVVAQGDALERADGVIVHERVLGRAQVIERRRLRWRAPSVSELRVVLRVAWRWVTG